MRPRSEIELEITEQVDRLAPDGSEERMLLGVIANLLLDIRDGQAVPRVPTTPPNLVGKAPNENWGPG